METTDHQEPKIWDPEHRDFILQLGGAKSNEEVASIFNAFYVGVASITAAEVQAIRHRYRHQVYHPRKPSAAHAIPLTAKGTEEIANGFTNAIPGASLTAAMIRAAGAGTLIVTEDEHAKLNLQPWDPYYIPRYHDRSTRSQEGQPQELDENHKPHQQPGKPKLSCAGEPQAASDPNGAWQNSHQHGHQDQLDQEPDGATSFSFDQWIKTDDLEE